MKRYVTLGLVAAVTVSAPAVAQEAVGDWSGLIEINAESRLPVLVHIQRSETGGLSGTLDSPGQNARGIPLSAISVEGGKLTFTVPSIQGSYAGTWDAEANGWRGVWSQSGMGLPLVLLPGEQGIPIVLQSPPPAALPENWSVPDDAAIRAVLHERNVPRAGEGIVAGVLTPEGRRIVADGSGAGAGVDGDTLFEIGSISKVFTALILADMVDKGEVSLDDPAEKYLPAGHHMPTRGGRQITLRDLSMHVSGLPRLPDNLPMTDPDDPYADYTEAMLLAFLDGYRLTRDIGVQAEYSNLGVGLLGYLLSRAAGKDYEALLRERVTGPLGMSDTLIALPPAQAGRLVAAFDPYMRPAKPWNLPLLMGAGGIRSTAGDMLKLSAAVLDPQSPIAPAVRTTLSARVPFGAANTEQALGWQVFHPQPGREVLLHNGGTGGFRSALAIDPAKRRATVVLVNSAAEPSATDLALHVLLGAPVAPTPAVPPAPPPVVQRTEVTLPAAELDRVTGRYDFGSGIVFVVTREGDGLRAQRQGSVTGPVLPIFAEAPLRFFWRAVDAQVRFTTDANGKVTGAEFTQGGSAVTGKRVGD